MSRSHFPVQTHKQAIVMNDPLSAESNPQLDRLINRRLLEVFIRVGLVGFLVVYCYEIFKPFIGLTLWSVILAVAIHPIHTRMTRTMGGRAGRAAAVLVLVLLFVVFVPTVLLALSFADSVTHFVEHVENGTLRVPPPPDWLASLPAVGQKLHAWWATAHSDLGQTLTQLAPKLRAVILNLLEYAKGVGTALLTFLVSAILAGIWLTYAHAGQSAAISIANRMAGADQGESLVRLSAATIRAVALGVIGIACIQAILLGAGFILMGVPGAGVLALFVLILGILQIPALLVSLPAIIYVFSTQDSTTAAIMFAVYSVVAGSVDSVLKPLMLGRGVDAPMPVILAGALGGLVDAGIIGLFLGAVILALGYQIFMGWVYRDARSNEAAMPTEG